MSQEEQADELTSELNDLYLYYDRQLRKAENDFMELEKEYYELSPRFEAILDHLDHLHGYLKKRGVPVAARRALNLKYVIEDFRQKRGYDIEGFHEIFGMIKLAIDKAPAEMISRSKIEALRSFTSQSMETLRSEVEALKRTRRYDLYLVTQAEGLTFLTLIQEKLWQKQIEVGPRVKIQMKSMPEPNLFEFHRIFSTQPFTQKDKKVQEAVLVKLPSGEIRGILADEVEGSLLISKKLVRRKTEYLHRGDNKYEPYFQMKGRRYFIRNELK